MPMRKRRTKGRRPLRRKMRKLRRKMRRRKGRATTAVMRGPSGFPDRIFVKLRYSDIQAYNITLGSASQQVFRGNGIFDPDQTSTGHQPYTFDQWSTFYSNYRVYGSKIYTRLICADNTSSATQGLFLNVHPALVTTGAASPFPINELPYSVTKIYGNTNSSTNPNNEIRMYMSTAKIFGTSKQTIKTDDTFQSLVTTTPSNQWYWHITVGTANLSSSSSSNLVHVQLTYYAEFWQRKQLSSS